MGLREEKAAAKAFRKLPRRDRTIVVYAEGRGDWAHVGPVVEELLGSRGQVITYLTSEEDDPVLERSDVNLRKFAIGDGAVRTTLFRGMEAGLLLTTVPDLETYSLKRSLEPVHYVYLFHAFVSTHMVYRPKAFDAFDTILCVGPHHAAEIRATEARYGLAKKRLVKHGYGRVDALMAERASRPASTSSEAPRVLIAGSWGEHALMENPEGAQLVDVLLGAGHEVIVRLHPMTVRHHPSLAEELAREHAGVIVETDMRSRESLFWSDVMVSEWSGASFDYALGLEKPVLYIDMPTKVNNPGYRDIDVEPIEVTLRSEIGTVLSPADMSSAPEAVVSLLGAGGQNLAALRDEYVYNVGSSAEAAATWLSAAAEKLNR